MLGHNGNERECSHPHPPALWVTALAKRSVQTHWTLLSRFSLSFLSPLTPSFSPTPLPFLFGGGGKSSGFYWQVICTKPLAIRDWLWILVAAPCPLQALYRPPGNPLSQCWRTRQHKVSQISHKNKNGDRWYHEGDSLTGPSSSLQQVHLPAGMW